jgi:ribosomal protein L37AE/L43A
MWRPGAKALLLIVTDGHWATRLRYQQKRLQRQLQAFDEFASLTRILFKVQPPTVQQGAAGIPWICRRCGRNHSGNGRRHQRPGLRQPAERLAAHARPK